MLTAIAEHSVLLPIDGVVIDVGCGTLDFARGVIAAGARHVIAIDPCLSAQWSVTIPSVTFMRVALVGLKSSEHEKFVECVDAECSTLKRCWNDGIPSRVMREYDVPVATLGEVLERMCVACAGLIKLDCEGAEYEILEHWPGAVAKQVSIEFHDHTTGRDIDELPEAFAKHYRVVQHDSYERRGRVSHWDSLFELRC